MQKSSFRYSDYNKSYKRWKRAIGDRGNVHQEQKYKINYQNQVRMSQNLVTQLAQYQGMFQQQKQ